MLTEHTIEDLIKGVMRHGPDILANCVANPNDIVQYLQRLDQERLDYPITKLQVDKSNWFIPQEYRTMDILDWLYHRCPTPEIRERVVEELRLFAKHDMIPVLKTMKYVVDTLRKNNIVWGVGRGSSVSSYVLYLIGIHKIDSVKYALPIDEFFKGEQNG
jgi:DNA polymerase III alpha subunit